MRGFASEVNRLGPAGALLGAAPPDRVGTVPQQTRSDLSGWRRHAAAAFIVVWLGVQILIPLVQKFELPGFQYRWARYSWGMFSRLGPRYEVRLFRTRGGGGAEPIPEMARYVRGYRSPEPMAMYAAYWSEDEVLDRFSRLVAYIARERRDGYAYVAAVEWIRYQRADLPVRMELRAESTP
jgi:hypothetical protein